MASVKQDGMFSLFPGYERSIAVIGGAGIHLRIGTAKEWIELQRSTPPFKFLGDEIIEAKLINGGAITDFNVFSKQERFTHQVSRFFLQPKDSPQRISLTSLTLSSTHILCPLRGDLVIKSSAENQDHHLLVQDGDSCVITQYDGDVELSCSGDASVELFLTDFYPRGEGSE